jgi:hypothetical protein
MILLIFVTDEQIFYEKFSYGKFYTSQLNVCMNNKCSMTSLRGNLIPEKECGFRQKALGEFTLSSYHIYLIFAVIYPYSSAVAPSC